MTGKILTRREVAEILRVTERNVDRMRADGRLKSFKMGGTAVRFWMSDVESLVRGR